MPRWLRRSCCFAPSVLHASTDADGHGHDSPVTKAASAPKAIAVPAKTSANSSDSKDSAWLKPSNNCVDHLSRDAGTKPGKEMQHSDSLIEGALTNTQPTGTPNGSRSSSLNSSNATAVVPHHLSSTENPSELTFPAPKSRNSQEPHRDVNNTSPFVTASNSTHLDVLNSQVSLPTTWSTLYSTSLPSRGMHRVASMPSGLAPMQSAGQATALPSQQRPAWRRLGGLLRSMQSDNGPTYATPAPLTRQTSSGSSTWSRSSSGGNLLSAAVTRVNSLQQLQLPGTDSKDAQAETICRQFADQFTKALLTGNATWGSAPEIGSILDESCEMVGHDGQVYVGRAAIIRRLNKGMEQFLKMLGVTGQDAEPSAIQVAARAGKIECSLEVASLSGTGISPSEAKGRRISTASSRGGLPPHHHQHQHQMIRSSVVVITYTFKAGMRKFKLQDRFKVRRGVICRLRRLRL